MTRLCGWQAGRQADLPACPSACSLIQRENPSRYRCGWWRGTMGIFDECVETIPMLTVVYRQPTHIVWWFGVWPLVHFCCSHIYRTGRGRNCERTRKAKNRVFVTLSFLIHPSFNLIFAPSNRIGESRLTTGRLA
jgi:hypothetical protein